MKIADWLQQQRIFGIMERMKERDYEAFLVKEAESFVKEEK